ncbi:MAG: hypothetical protein LZ174_10475 [Thaumarchaeota archaeon]|jgi:hypothetical protein|nr:hypothetical protein [Candidatus Geocrenenecus arthurdayi]
MEGVNSISIAPVSLPTIVQAPDQSVTSAGCSYTYNSIANASGIRDNAASRIEEILGLLCFVFQKH